MTDWEVQVKILKDDVEVGTADCLADTFDALMWNSTSVLADWRRQHRDLVEEES